MLAGVLSVAAAQPAAGFRWGNLAVLVVAVLVLYPLVRRARRSASRSRLRRWEAEGLVPGDAPPAEPPDPRDSPR
ncbi:MAG TPA: hypothetical protein VFJ97_12205 [Dermatophilaceae bacterium]|nr:hypothetical protein [Dermatophilaceae bacterium]